MRIVKLSKDLFGFDTNGACKAYLKDVLPWTGGNYHFAGNGNKIALDKFSEGENILFSHDGSIVAIVKGIKLLTEGDKCSGIEVDMDTMKIFKEGLSILALEKSLEDSGHHVRIFATQGWNYLEGDCEKAVLEFLKNEDWKIY